MQKSQLTSAYINMKRLNINIHDDIYQHLQTSAQSNGQSKTYIVEQALKQYLGQNEETSASINTDADNTDRENLEARIARIEDALFGNDKNILDRAEQAFDNYAGLEDSLNDLWEQHSEQRQQIQELKDGFSGLSCEIQRDRQHKSSKKSSGKKTEFSETIEGLGKMAEHLGIEKDELKNNIQNKQKDDLIYFNGEKWRIKRKDRGGYSFGKLD